jgi:uncharacterized damage-inducible protein DinB
MVSPGSHRKRFIAVRSFHYRTGLLAQQYAGELDRMAGVPEIRTLEETSMKKSVALLVFAALLLAMNAAAQGKASAKAPRPAQSATQEALTAWNEIGRKLVAMAEDWPESKYDYKPTPEVRSFAEQLLHVAGTNYYFTNTALDKELGPEDLPRDKYKTKADIVAALKKSFADGAEAFKQKGDAGMSATVKHPFGNYMAHLASIAWDVTEHSGEHYGNLVVYYRLNKMVPPESRPRR